MLDRMREGEGECLADWNSMVIPALAIASANAYKLWNEHWEHWHHMPPLEERTEYPYQNIRSRNFFWGNGDKVSFSSNHFKLNIS